MASQQLPERWKRIVPIAFLIYTVAFMDRVNIGFAADGMAREFGASQATIGLTLGSFFAGYALLQIPAGYVADRWGTKVWVTALLVLWAVVAVASGLARTMQEELWARFLLGVAEGGLWPAILVLIARWFPREERASANALFQMCLPVGALVSAPLSGWLVKVLGWREMLIIEGLPPLLWAVAWWFVVADTPSSAPWLPTTERSDIEARLARERVELAPVPLAVGWTALIHPTIWLITIAYFFSIVGSYGLQLWGPTIIKSSGVDTSLAGWLLAIPNLAGIVVMAYVGRLSDRLRKRKAVVAVTLLAAFIGLMLMALLPHASTAALIVFMSIATAGIFARQGPLWAIPTQILPAGAVGLAFALIGLVGNLGGLAGPWLMGYVRGATNSFLLGFVALATCMAIAAVMILFVPEDRPIKLSRFSLARNRPGAADVSRTV